MKKFALLLVLSSLLMVGFTVNAQSPVVQYLVIGNGNGLEAKIARAGGVVVNTFPQINMAVAQSSNPQFASSVQGVQSVIVDYAISSPDVEVQELQATAFTQEVAESFNNPPNDPFYNVLWGLDAVNAPEAWAAGLTGEGVTVAVLDEGFHLNAVDQEWAPGEASFVCYTDPTPVFDENGDLDFIDSTPSTDPADCKSVQYNLDEAGPLTPADVAAFSHGTHVAGTINATADNGIGVVGVAPDADVIPVKVLSDFLGYGYSSWIIEGILYATDLDVDIINMSLGGSFTQGVGPGSNELAALRVAYNRAVNYAYQNGTVVVSSAGNSSFDADGDGSRVISPAGFERSISVSATAPTGFIFGLLGSTDFPDAFNFNQPTSYTNYGTSHVDFSAPGGDFLCSDTLASGFPGCAYDLVLSTGGESRFYFSGGTSMAAPHLTGVAALIIQELGGDVHPAHVERELRQRAEDAGAPGNDDFHGQGAVRTGY